MISDIQLDAIATNDRVAMVLKLASNMTGGEVAVYFAIRAFYANPSFQKARRIRTVFINSNAEITLNFSSSVAAVVKKKIDHWDQFISTGHGNPQDIKAYRTTLFDAFWNQGILGNTGGGNDFRDFIPTPPVSSNVNQGSATGYVKVMKRALANLALDGISL